MSESKGPAWSSYFKPKNMGVQSRSRPEIGKFSWLRAAGCFGGDGEVMVRGEARENLAGRQRR